MSEGSQPAILATSSLRSSRSTELKPYSSLSITSDKNSNIFTSCPTPLETSTSFSDSSLVRLSVILIAHSEYSADTEAPIFILFPASFITSVSFFNTDSSSEYNLP
mgnify:CR=1 FL=1